MRKNVLFITIWFATAATACLLPSPAAAQPIHPLSLDLSPGVHLVSCDSLTHRSAAHYEALCRIVLTEFGLPTDSICLTVVFVDDDLMAALKEHNSDRFESDRWQGMYINNYLVMVDGSREADDTFMHEFLHVLNHQSRLFQHVPAGDVHELIRLNETLLMGSQSYLNYLRSLLPLKEDSEY